MKQQSIQRVLNLSLCLVFLFSLVGVPPVQAGTGVPPVLAPTQSLAEPEKAAALSGAAPAPPPPPPAPEGARLGYNSVTGRLNFVGSDASAPLASAGGMSAMAVRSAADGVLAQYAPEFGVQNPAKDLRLARTTQDEHGSAMRYQQTYQGIPILGGELIVNSDTQGQVLSLNGEVSPDLTLSTTTPAISSGQALQAALAGAKLWYGLDAAEIVASQPALWIYDPRILQDDSQAPIRLVWRIELTSGQADQPVNELVLVDAATGDIALHFSQVEEATGIYDEQPTPTAEPSPETPTSEPPQDTPGAQPTETPPTQATPEPPTPTETPSAPPVEQAATRVPQGDMQAQSGVIWYVSTAGSDANDCATPATPCGSINAAIAKASDGDVVEIAAGPYLSIKNESVKITRSIDLIGGWNEDFTAQTGISTIDGENKRIVIIIGTGDQSTSQPEVTTTLDRLIVIRGMPTTANGSGIYADANSSVTIRNSAIRLNYGYNENQAGIFSYMATSLKVINSTISENSGGGGIYAFGNKNVEIRNTTIYFNSNYNNNQGPGLGVRSSTQPTQLILANSIIAGNNNGSSYPNCYLSNVTLLAAGYNLTTRCNGYTISPGDIIVEDPKLGAPVPGGYIPLRPGSPAIDAGNPVSPGSGGTACETSDQAGNPRPVDGNSDGINVCDIGAYETGPLKPSVLSYISIYRASQTRRINESYFPNATTSTTALDQYGLSVAGVQVTFTAPADGPSGYFNPGGTQVSVTTDSNGVAKAPSFIANGIAGKFHLIVSAPGATPGVYYMENYVPAATTFTTGSDSDSVFGRVSSGALQIYAWDQFLRPLQGALLTASAPASGPSLIFTSSQNNVATSITDADGMTTFPATVNDINGTYPVTVTAEGAVQPLVISITNATYYLSPNGSDNIGGHPNDCLSPDSPCLTFPDASSSTLQDGSSFLLEKGIYSWNNVVNRLNRAGFSGGWDSTFTIQNGQTIIQRSTDVAAGDVFDNYGQGVGIEKITFTDAQNGTGIYNFYPATLSLEAVTASHNNYGFRNESTATVINSTFSENDTGIVNYAIMDLKNVTVARNRTGIYEDDSSGPGNIYPKLTFQNSIISKNEWRNCYVYFGLITSNGYNLFDTSNGCLADDTYGDYTSNSSDLTGVDPKLNQLIQDTYVPLLPGSPAIDGINGAGAYCPSTDQRGVSRPTGNYCDIGAIEYIDLTPPYIPFVFSGSDQPTYPGNFYWDPIEVQVLDHYGTPVAGVTVTFAGPASGASVIFKDGGTNVTTAVTDATGWARVSNFSANLIPGEFVVTASVDLMAAPAEFHLNNSLAATYLDSTTGSDTNTCQSALTPCKTLDAAIQQTPDQGTILIASGVLPLVSSPTQDGGGFVNRVYVNGGWNHAFTVQDGYSNLVGNNMDDGLVPHFYVNKDAIVRTNLIAIGGGGVINDGTLYFTNGMVTNNPKAVDNRAMMEITNVTFTGNTCLPDFSPCGYARYTAGVITSYGSVLKLTNVTMVENYIFDRLSDSDTPIEAGAVVNEGGTIYIQNSIIAWNLTDQRSDFSGKIISLGHNLLGKVYESSFTSAEGDVYGTPSKPLDPMLAEPADNGGGMLSVAPMQGSPAIGGGDPAACPKTDQRGVPRPEGAACTIGAYEGSVPFSVEQQPVIVFDARNTTDMPGYYLCQTFGSGPACSDVDDPDVTAAVQTSIDFSKFLSTIFQRNGLDDARRVIIPSVHSKATTNAFWDGTFVVMAKSWPKADDVIGHELTHGVIDYVGSLMYYYETGAIDESLADMWGEYFDQTNGRGNDSSIVKWLIGEDAPGGAVRSMSNPPAHKQPDSMTSALFYKNSSDNGGVHTNSGVNNKAAYLMVQGGSFNGKTIAPLGWEKTSAIYYYTLGHLLTSAADYADLYMALDQGCRTLVGTHGISLADCQQARNATDAVKMNIKPSGSYHFETTNTCPTGMTKLSSDLFFDDFENGDGKWVFGANYGNNHWAVDPGFINFSYATSGTHELFGNDYDDTKRPDEQDSDSFASMKDNVAIPGGVKVFLYFNHAYGFEMGSGHYYDGGVLEYDLDGSEKWNSASALFDAGNNYNGTVYAYMGDNPLAGHKAFVGPSHGYISSRYNLTSLAGHTVRFRWRIGTDYTGYDLGWAVDDVEVYQCVGNPGVPALVSPTNNALTTAYLPRLDWKDADNADHYWLQVAYDPNFSNLVIDKKTIAVSEFTPDAALPDNKTLYWRVLTVNHIDISSAWSSVYSFRTPMLPPNLVRPGNGINPPNLRPTFEWSSVDTATSYSLQVSTSLNFSSTLVNLSQPALSYTPTSNLTANKTIYWRVKANGANPSAWSSPSSYLSPNPPATPSLSSPADKSLVTSYLPRLDWSTSTLPSGTAFVYYRLQIALDSSFSSIVQDMQVNGLTNSEKTLTIPLDPDLTFYWHVCAYNNASPQAQYSAWSTTRSLRTPMRSPGQVKPVDGDKPATARPTFQWDAIPRATSYSLQVSTSSKFSSTLVNTTLSALTYTPTGDLPHGATLYWRVKANGINPSNWSDFFTFTNANPPATPSLVTPADGIVLSGYLPSLDWTDVAAIDHYEVQISTTSTFDTGTVGIDHIGAHGDPSNFIPDAPLTANRTFYWRVLAINADKQISNWSPVRHFSTQLNQPLLSSPGNGTTLPTPITLNWGSVSEATGYTVQISTSQGFGTPVVNRTVTATAYSITASLTKGKTYYWHVQAKGDNPSAWSEVWSFLVQ